MAIVECLSLAEHERKIFIPDRQLGELIVRARANGFVYSGQFGLLDRVYKYNGNSIRLRTTRDLSSSKETHEVNVKIPVYLRPDVKSRLEWTLPVTSEQFRLAEKFAKQHTDCPVEQFLKRRLVYTSPSRTIESEVLPVPAADIPPIFEFLGVTPQFPVVHQAAPSIILDQYLSPKVTPKFGEIESACTIQLEELCQLLEINPQFTRPWKRGEFFRRLLEVRDIISQANDYYNSSKPAFAAA